MEAKVCDMNYTCLSEKQELVMTWWYDHSSYKNKNGVICDGAVRSGKSQWAGLSYVRWAMHNFDGGLFAMCGETIASLKRNIINLIVPVMEASGFNVKQNASTLEVSIDGRSNKFCLFGAQDESSAICIDGYHFDGALFDSVNCISRRFVEQIIACCTSIECKLWFISVPEHPYHWFYNEWIKQANEHDILYVHFTMADNLGISLESRERYEKLYTGAFYERFIEGKWVSAKGLIYPMFAADKHIKHGRNCDEHYLSVDYGTINPFSCGLWGHNSSGWYRLKEYYYSSRDRGIQLTDEEYYEAMQNLIEDRKITAIVVDPSAASFIETIKRHGDWPVIKADNDLLSGIHAVCCALNGSHIYISPECEDTIREFSLYRWRKDINRDSPLKENDHTMDDIRYFVQTIIYNGGATQK